MMDAPGFSAWHADVANSPACALIFQRALGLPSQVVSNSLLTGAGIAEVATALRVAPGQVLVDLACGRGGLANGASRTVQRPLPVVAPGPSGHDGHLERPAR